MPTYTQPFRYLTSEIIVPKSTAITTLQGNPSGLTVIGGSGSGSNMTLQSTSHATKGKLLFGTSAYDEVNNRLGINTASPDALFQIGGTAANDTRLLNIDGTYVQTTGAIAGVLNFSPVVNIAADAAHTIYRYVPSIVPSVALTSALTILNNNVSLGLSSSNITTMILAGATPVLSANYSGTVTSVRAFNAGNPTISGGAITNYFGYFIPELSNATNSAGFVATGTSSSGNNVCFLSGTGTIPTGDFDVYFSESADKIFLNGNMGIGTAAPASLLDVASATGGIHTLRRVDTSVTANDMVGKLQFYAADTSTTTNFIVADIEAQATNTISTDINPGRLIFRTTSTTVAATPTEQMRISETGKVTVSNPTGGLGYGTGAGGTVTQITSRTTGVTVNTVCGAITLVSAAGSAAWQSFTVTNSTVAATDTIIVNQKSGTDLYMTHITAVAAGSFRITYATTGGTTTEQPVFNFAIIKAVTS